MSGPVRPGRLAHQEVVGVMGLAIPMAKEGWMPMLACSSGSAHVTDKFLLGTRQKGLD